ncbi:MAG: maltotransferase domain-containing protein, partial [Vicinamibacteria bacterium]
MPRKSERPVAILAVPELDGRARAVVDAVLPVVDDGRFAVKRIAGEPFEVKAHCFADGHDALRVLLIWWAEGDGAEHEIPMRPLGNDVWTAAFTPPSPGRYRYNATAWVDRIESWRSELARRVELADVRQALLLGAIEVEAAAERAGGADRAALRRFAKSLGASAAEPSNGVDTLKALALDPLPAELAARYPDRAFAARYPKALPLIADRERARFSTWYEMFPRSASAQSGRHGTFADVASRLDAIAAMGFDVLYFPPIHPIGTTQRKGRNNALVAAPGDVGSPWAIGAATGGHKSILPELGTPDDFRDLISSARKRGIEIALDLAFQCSPDHPYLTAHPDWFRMRPDGSVQYAENPPKK